VRKTCRSCRHYNNRSGTCCYFRADVPVILDDNCRVWSKKEDVP